MNGKPPVDYVRYGAVSLPIRHDPVTILVQDPHAARVEGQPVPMVEKTYDSYYVDARCAGRGRLRAPSVSRATNDKIRLMKQGELTRAQIDFEEHMEQLQRAKTRNLETGGTACFPV